MYLDGWTPEPPPVIDETAFHETEPLLIAWEHTFSKLDALGDADQIYAWGQQMWQDKQRLGQRIDMMPSWDTLLYHWVSEPDADELARPLYSQKMAHELRQQTLDHFQWLLDVRASARLLKQNPENKWEDFVFRMRLQVAWISQMSTFYILLSYWKRVLCGKTREDIAMIQQWGENLNVFLAPYASYYVLFPLQELADDICDGDSIR